MRLQLLFFIHLWANTVPFSKQVFSKEPVSKTQRKQRIFWREINAWYLLLELYLSHKKHIFFVTKGYKTLEWAEILTNIMNVIITTINSSVPSFVRKRCQNIDMGAFIHIFTRDYSRASKQNKSEITQNQYGVNVLAELCAREMPVFPSCSVLFPTSTFTLPEFVLWGDSTKGVEKFDSETATGRMAH